MALSAAIVWECRASGASDSNGGGFVAGAAGTDRSQQNAAQVAIDNSTITTSITTNVITFTGGYTPTSADVGNIVQMLTGTNVTAGFYQITAQTSTTWTVDRNVVTSGTTVNATGTMGGALATLGKLAAAMVASNKAYATGAFTSTATTTFAQTVTPTGANPPTRLIGYGATRGDSTHATLTLSTNTGLTGIKVTGNGFNVEQIDVDCGSLGTSIGIQHANFSRATRCKISNFTSSGITMTGTENVYRDCEITGGTSAATAAINEQNGPQYIHSCFIHDNACTGILLSTGAEVVSFCLIVNNSGASSDGIQGGTNHLLLNNTIHNNGRDGIRLFSTNQFSNLWQNNLITSNGGWGINNALGTALPADPNHDGNAYFSNTSGTRNNLDSTAGIYGVAPYTNVRDVILSGSPYVGGTTGTTANFALNNTAGAGAACRAAALPGTWAGNTGTTGYLDMGAVQHQDSGGSSGPVGSGRLTGGLQ